MRAAFLSCSDKTGLTSLARSLTERSFRLVATDGTFDFLRREGLANVTRVSDLTRWPEMLGGRVKSLHPAIFGSILADRDKTEHMNDVRRAGLLDMCVVAVNLYPFSSQVKETTPTDEAVALMDIGGVACVRAAAKNHKHVTVLSDPRQYDQLEDALASESIRRDLAANAFHLTCEYDFQISTYLSASAKTTSAAPSLLLRRYTKVSDLKYGCNPHQKPAALYASFDDKEGLKLLNGNWGYINILDAVNAWGLVSEMQQQTGLVSAASFKHTQPAGAAVGCDYASLSPSSKQLLTSMFGLSHSSSPSVIAYARARNCDPLSSFGDFIGFSGIVDKQLAEFVASQISDGIVAGGYTDEALAVLKGKKQGSYVVVQCGSAKQQPLELRDVAGGFALAQHPNLAVIDRVSLTKNVPTLKKMISEATAVDLMLANACLKFAQSNSVAVASGGQVIAVASGQQSRVDAVRLVREKANIWIRRHSEQGISVFSGLKGPKQDRIVAGVEWARSDGSSVTSNVVSTCLASDGFFPFADGIEEATGIMGLSHISQPGGSMRDADTVAMCDKHGLVMSLTGTRIFSH